MKFVVYAGILSIFLSNNVFANKTNTIGYGTVKEALTELKKNKSADISLQGDWTIISIEENGTNVLWSFTPENHAAHPAVIKRSVIKMDDAIGIDMKALCQAKKEQCDNLMKEFEQLNDNIRKSMKKGT